MFSGLFKLLNFLSVAAVQFATHRLLITELDSVDRQQSSELLKYPRTSKDPTLVAGIPLKFVVKSDKQLPPKNAHIGMIVS